VSVRTVERMERSGVISAVRFGRTVRFVAPEPPAARVSTEARASWEK
jgi:hypothetical protein